MQKTLIVLLSLLLALSFIVGCSAGGNEVKPTGSEKGPTQQSSQPSQTSAPTGEVVSSKDTMTIGAYGEPESLFPANDGKIPGASVAANLYETLMTMDAEGNVLPLLAVSYTNVDEKTYEFKLKEGVKFHNGEELKASDVVFTFQHLVDNPKTATYSEPLDASTFEVVDDYTVRIGTKKPFAPMLRMMCNPAMSIFNQKHFEEASANGTLDITAVGTGAFKVVEWNDGDNVLLERFEDYHGEPAKMKYLNFRYIPEQNSRLLELETGGIDLMTEVPGVSIEQIEDTPGLTMWNTPGASCTFLALNFDRELLQDTNVRLAIAHSVNTDALRKTVVMDAALTADGVLSPVVPGALVTGGYNYDTEKAKALLADAGYPNGIELELAFYQSADNRRTGEALQAMMEPAGIKLALNELDTSSYTPFLNTREQQAAITTIVNTLRDPHQTFSKLYSSAVGLGGNRVNYANEEMDAMLNEAAAEMNEAKRMDLYKAIQEKIYEEVVWIPIYFMNVCTATVDTLRGYEVIYPASYQNYKNCYFVEP